MSTMICIGERNGLKMFVEAVTGCFSIEESDKQWSRLCDMKAHMDKYVSLHTPSELSRKYAMWRAGMLTRSEFEMYVSEVIERGVPSEQ